LAQLANASASPVSEVYLFTHYLLKYFDYILISLFGCDRNLMMTGMLMMLCMS